MDIEGREGVRFRQNSNLGTKYSLKYSCNKNLFKSVLSL